MIQHILNYTQQNPTRLSKKRTTSGHLICAGVRIMKNELKPLVESISIDEQITNLKEIGLIIEDENNAREILNNISYFRIIKAYSLRLKPKNGTYGAGVKFEDITNLYFFNANLRHILFPIIEIVEINLRCRIANYFSLKYGVLGYKEKDNFENHEYHKELLMDIEAEVGRNSRAPFIKNYKENYENGEIPLYALVEVFSFGTLSKFFKNMHPEDKKEISKTFGVGYTYFESWIENIAYVRNMCAHYGRLYNAKMVKTPILYKEYGAASRGDKGKIPNNRLFATILCLKHILRGAKQWHEFVEKLEELVCKYDVVDVSTMGFSEDWVDILKD